MKVYVCNACTLVRMILNRIQLTEMHDYIAKKGYALDITDFRYQYGIYLSDPRKASSEKLKTVIRHPIMKLVNNR